jgi:uncharacterized protein (TIGR00661 family)
MKADIVTRGYHTFAKKYVILNFFRASLHNSRAILAAPVVRQCVTKLPVSQQDHVVVYSTDSKPDTKQTYLTLFGRLAPRPFYIYGFNVEERHGNCFFKKNSTPGFLEDLASCRGVIATAGFSLISECLYLKKRMLLTPVGGQFEQIVNAAYAQRLGFARYPQRLDDQPLRLFLNDTEKEFPNDERILWPDNEGFFRLLNHTLNESLNPAGITLNLTASGVRTPSSGIISCCG